MVRSLPSSPTKNIHCPAISSYVQFAEVSASEYANNNRKQLNSATVDNIMLQYSTVIQIKQRKVTSAFHYLGLHNHLFTFDSRHLARDATRKWISVNCFCETETAKQFTVCLTGDRSVNVITGCHKHTDKEVFTTVSVKTRWVELSCFRLGRYRNNIWQDLIGWRNYIVSKKDTTRPPMIISTIVVRFQ